MPWLSKGHLAGRQPALRWLEWALYALAVVCLGIYIYAFLDARWFEMRQSRRLEEALHAKASANAAARPRPGGAIAAMPPPSSAADRLGSFRASAQPPALPEGELLGRIEVPRVHVSALVLEGVDPLTLRRGVGHIPGTALPRQPGNVGLAGHRDKFFRGLKDVRRGDVITLTTPDGTFHYHVDWTRIVEPHDTAVLDPSPQPSLTLVTCYPFYYIGSAPDRFIVRAHLEPGERG
jgi:sortase A